MASSIKMKTRNRKTDIGQTSKRGRLAIQEWQFRARYALRYLGDPIALQRSPLCRLSAIDGLANAKYPNGVVARGRVLNDLIIECLQEIESELDGHAGAARLKSFIILTRQGKGVTEASRALAVTPEYASRAFKRDLVELLAEKLLIKLH